MAPTRTSTTTLPRPAADVPKSADQRQAPARRMPAWARPLPEAVLLAALYAAYRSTRNLLGSARGQAVARGQAIERFESRLHLDPERALNHFVAAHPALATICDYEYAAAHFAITLIVMVLLYRRHRPTARRLAAAWYLTNLLALLGFWLYALAPPRLLPGGGFIDTVVVFHTWGSWGTGAVASASNQYAAMPSLHIAWASWCAVGIWQLTRRDWVRLLGICYPLATLFVVLGTANHYLVDAVAGLLTLIGGFALTEGGIRSWSALQRSRHASASEPGRAPS
jgi:hypothetical protein